MREYVNNQSGPAEIPSMQLHFSRTNTLCLDCVPLELRGSLEREAMKMQDLYSRRQVLREDGTLEQMESNNEFEEEFYKIYYVD